MTVDADEEDAATAVLWEQGTMGIEVRAAGPSEAELLAYFPDGPGLQERLRAALASLPGARLRPAAVPDVDWVARYRAGFRSFSAAGFRIVPAWELPAAGVPAGDVLVVDPGRAFGTGTHESTRLCLGLLRDLSARGPLGRVLDLGTGSGILAVAAARLGARVVVGVDLDEEALSTAKRQARLNRVELPLVRADLATAVHPARFDLVLANIAAPLLVERSGEIAALRAPVTVLSGLLTADLDPVRRAYAHAGRLETRTDGEWAAVMVEGRTP